MIIDYFIYLINSYSFFLRDFYSYYYELNIIYFDLFIFMMVIYFYFLKEIDYWLSYHKILFIILFLVYFYYSISLHILYFISNYSILILINYLFFKYYTSYSNSNIINYFMCISMLNLIFIDMLFKIIIQICVSFYLFVLFN
jgi:hypothetical protein